MALSTDLVGFVKESLQRGLPRADVEKVLLRAGWPAEQVRRALNSFSDVEFAIPVPRPVPSVSARDAFMYVVMFATLILSGYNLGDLLFELIQPRLRLPERTWRLCSPLAAWHAELGGRALNSFSDVEFAIRSPGHP